MSKEQELILELLNKIEDSSVQLELYEIFKKSVHKLENKKNIDPYNLDEILTRFNQKSPK